MKQILTILLIGFASISIAQFDALDKNGFKPFLNSIDKGELIYSLDSIVETKFKADQYWTTSFTVKDKNADLNVIKAVIDKTPISVSVPYRDSISIKYFDQDQLSEYIRFHNFFNVYDTSDYLIYDLEGRLIMEQDRFELYCGTGDPNDESIEINIYDNQDKLLKRSNKIKWNYDYEPFRPYNIWVDNYDEEYYYSGDTLERVYHRYNYSLYLFDSVGLELSPYLMEYYEYENGKLYEKRIDSWDTIKQEWRNYRLEQYSYKIDTTIIEFSIWDTENHHWNKTIRRSIWTENEHDKVLSQKWDLSQSRWTNNYIDYYEYADVEGYFNYYVESWNPNLASWELSRNTEYSNSEDTIIQTNIYKSGNDYRYHYLYNSQGLLKVQKVYNKNNGEWKLNYELNNFYNDDNVLVNSVYDYSEFSYYNQDKVVINYYWDGITTIKETDVITSFQIIPNPVNDYLTVLSDYAIDKILIYDLRGNLVISARDNIVFVGDLSAGNYVLSLILEDEIRRIKLFVKE